jgi:hypothetical protein
MYMYIIDIFYSQMYILLYSNLIDNRKYLCLYIHMSINIYTNVHDIYMYIHKSE